MRIFHSRSVLNKKAVRILLGFVIVALLFFWLPSSSERSGVSSLSGTEKEKGWEEDAQHYEAALVVASQTKDNTTWLRENYKSWRKEIYVVDDATARLTVPVNKGREAMVYLTYIIDHYHNLEDVTIFIHAERYQWHNDDPDYDGQRTLSRLNTTHILSQGYASLRCAWILGCPEEIRPYIDAGRSSVPPKAGEVYKQSFEQLFPGVVVPRVVGTACCAQFAASKEAIRSRSKADYERYRRWIIETDIRDDLSGRVLEYSWHIIFGKESVFCPNAADCYCNLYGLCDLQCRKDACRGRYDLPPYSSLPEGWPEMGWEGEWRQVHDY